jgi:hypothetical protein
MPKTGSTTIQQWIGANARSLLADRDILTVVASYAKSAYKVRPSDPWSLDAYTGGRVNSSQLLALNDGLSDLGLVGEREAFLDVLFDRLGVFAGQHDTVLISGEGFSSFFWRCDEPFLARLEAFAHGHDVTVAYYVRPQHTSLEAAWRHWGFRQGEEPSAYVRRLAERLCYLETFDAVSRSAPNVSFDVRPFRTDLLDGGSPASDFAHRYFDVPPGAIGRAETYNRGLALDLANMLRLAPEELRGSAEIESRNPIRNLTAEWPVVESEKAVRGRRLLQAFCHRTFEAGNLELIRRLGWEATEFVPAPLPGADGEVTGADLDLLDALWSPDASEAELRLFYAALTAALRRSDTSIHPRAESSSRGSRRAGDRVGARALRRARRLVRRPFDAVRTRVSGIAQTFTATGR